MCSTVVTRSWGSHTATQAEGVVWFSCRGTPVVLLQANKNLRFTGEWGFPASVGIAPTGGGRFLSAHNTTLKGAIGTIRSHNARVLMAQPDERTGIVIEKP